MVRGARPDVLDGAIAYVTEAGCAIPIVAAHRNGAIAQDRHLAPQQKTRRLLPPVIADAAHGNAAAARHEAGEARSIGDARPLLQEAIRLVEVFRHENHVHRDERTIAARRVAQLDQPADVRLDDVESQMLANALESR